MLFYSLLLFPPLVSLLIFNSILVNQSSSFIPSFRLSSPLLFSSPPLSYCLLLSPLLLYLIVPTPLFFLLPSPLLLYSLLLFSPLSPAL